jgi:hypothetical protein
MRDDAQRSTTPITPTTLTTFTTPNRHDAAHASSSSERGLDPRLTTAAADTARYLRAETAGWPAEDAGALVYAVTLVRLKSQLPGEAFADLQRHYREHRAAFLARLRRRAD